VYFSDEIILITTDDSGTDEIGRQTETEMGRVTVYGDIKSVSREESFTAGSHGYRNSCCTRGITAARNTPWWTAKES
jgi:hypothetical protein